jgi:hypothetical protein
MAAIQDRIYFPSLGDCLKGDQVILSVPTTLGPGDLPPCFFFFLICFFVQKTSFVTDLWHHIFTDLMNCLS